jgi:hypothetical protein
MIRRSGHSSPGKVEWIAPKEWLLPVEWWSGGVVSGGVVSAAKEWLLPVEWWSGGGMVALLHCCIVGCEGVAFASGVVSGGGMVALLHCWLRRSGFGRKSGYSLLL